MVPRLVPRKGYFPVLTNNIFCNSLIQLVGTTGFEPATPCPPDKCATKLRYAPKLKYFYKPKVLCTQPSNNQGVTYHSKQLHMMILFKEIHYILKLNQHLLYFFCTC